MLTRAPYIDRDPFGTRAAIAARNATPAAVPTTAKCVWSVRPAKRGGVVSWHATLTVTVPGTGSVVRATESRSGPTECAAIYSLQSSGAWQTLAAFGITPERIE